MLPAQGRCPAPLAALASGAMPRAPPPRARANPCAASQARIGQTRLPPPPLTVLRCAAQGVVVWGEGCRGGLMLCQSSWQHSTRARCTTSVSPFFSRTPLSSLSASLARGLLSLLQGASSALPERRQMPRARSWHRSSASRVAAARLRTRGPLRAPRSSALQALSRNPLALRHRTIVRTALLATRLPLSARSTTPPASPAKPTTSPTPPAPLCVPHAQAATSLALARQCVPPRLGAACPSGR